MKLIVAIIRPEKLEAVQAALNERDVYLMTVSDVRGCGRQRGYTEVYRGTEFQVRLLPKLKSTAMTPMSTPRVPTMVGRLAAFITGMPLREVRAILIRDPSKLIAASVLGAWLGRVGGTAWAA